LVFRANLFHPLIRLVHMPFANFLRSPVLRSLRFPAVLMLALPLLACAADEDATDRRPRAEIQEVPPEQLYDVALKQMDRGNWVPCAAAFDEVERQHPFSVWARRAILMSAFCYYQGYKYNESIMASDRFITLHPGNKDAPYAYYLKAVSLYEQIVDVGRDQRRTEQAMGALRELIKRFPQTDYARDARLKLDLTQDHLAGKEMAIGRYYLQRGEVVAAITRFRTVVGRFQTTSHVPEALHRLVEAYLSLGVIKEAQAAAAVLGNNYPGSEWYEDSYAMMQEYGNTPHPGGRKIDASDAAATPAAAPAEAPVEAVPAVAAPKPSAEVQPEAPADTQAADASKKKDENGGFFSWF
jgi:outer membrane protein assembly factor BamD